MASSRVYETGDADGISDTWNAIALQGEVREIRCLEVDGGGGFTHTEAGFFDNRESVVAALRKVKKAKGIYFTLNPVNPALMARANSNCLKKAGKGDATTDGDIIKRCFLPIDVDPKRPTGISSSNAEHAAALAKAKEIAAYLKSLGWPEGILADSGNGAHLIYRIDMPVDDGGLVKANLEWLAGKFNDDVVTIDTVNHNPSRIWKFYGTWARKGADTTERPHRLSRAYQKKSGPPIDLALLEANKKQTPTKQRPSPTPSKPYAVPDQFSIDSWIRKHGLDVTGPVVNSRGDKAWTFRACPFNSEHCNGEVGIVEQGNGKLGFHCFHESCKHQNWHSLREKYEPRYHRPQAEPPVRVEFTGTKAPPFPIDGWPTAVREFVRATAIATQTPLDMGGMLALGAIAAANAKKFVVKIRDGWVEPMNLYIAIAMEPGERKSGIFRAMCGPLMDWEERESVRVGPLLAAAATRKTILQQQADKAARTASEGKGKDSMLEAEDLAMQLASFEMPPTPRLTAGDITPERLAALMAETQGRIALMSAEGGGPFSMMAGRYQTGAAPNLDVYLCSYSGDTLRLDRAKDKQSVYVTDPALTIAIALQPSAIRDMALTPQLRGRGLLARFLFTLPKSLMGSRDISPPSVPSMAREAYASCLHRLLELPVPRTPAVLLLTPEAEALHLDLMRSIEPRLGPDGDLAAVRDWAAKLCGTVARTAGNLHVMRAGGFGDGLISGDTMKAAIDHGLYSLEHAIAVFAEMEAAPGEEMAKRIMDWVAAKGLTEFTRRDAQRRFKKTPDDIMTPLSLLVDRGLIALIPQDQHQPRSQSYTVASPE